MTRRFMSEADLAAAAARKHEAEVIGYQWEVTADHPRLWPPYRGGKSGPAVVLGERGPVFSVDQMEPGRRPWGLVQVWIMRNGQEVRVREKEITP